MQVSFSAPIIAAQPSTDELLTILHEAEDYTRVLPSKTRELLQQQERHIHALSPEWQIEWHLVMFKSAQQLLDLQQMEQSLNSVMQWHNEGAFILKLSRIINSLGIWFRKSGYPKEAQIAYFCALDNTQAPRQRLSMLTNIAVTYRNLGQNEDAIYTNKLASQLAMQLGSEMHQAVINNNLGVLFLNENKLDLAASHLLSALNINQTLSRRSGQILSGINLMQVYLRQQQMQNYQRIYPRIKRLLQVDNNQARKSYLKLINSVYLLRNGTSISSNKKRELQRAFDNLGDKALKNMLYPYTQELGLTLSFTPDKMIRHYSGSWLKQLKQCDWKTYRQPNYIRQWSIEKSNQKDTKENINS